MSLRVEHLILLAAGGCLLVLLLPRLHSIFRNSLIIVILANVFATVVIDYVPGDILHLGYLRVLIILILLAAAIPSLRLDSVGLSIIIFLVYLGLLIPLSSDPVASLDGYLKVFISLAMYTFAFSLVRNGTDLRRGFLGFALGGLLIATSFLIAQVFNLGHAVYGDHGAHTGGGGVHQTVLLAYYILALPLLWELSRDNPRFRWFSIAVAAAGVIVLLLVFRRGSILAVMVGLSVWALLTPQKKLVVRGACVASIFALLISPMMYERLTILYQERVVEGKQSYVDGEAGRMQDIERALHAFKTGGMTHALIGSEAFRDRAYFNTNRPVHVDYARILVGSGLIGLGLYLLIYFQVLRASLARVIRSGNYEARVGFAVVCALVVGSLIISFSSQIYVVSSLSWLFLLLGAINGWFREACAEKSRELNVQHLESGQAREKLSRTERVLK